MRHNATQVARVQKKKINGLPVSRSWLGFIERRLIGNNNHVTRFVTSVVSKLCCGGASMKSVSGSFRLVSFHPSDQSEVNCYDRHCSFTQRMEYADSVHHLSRFATRAKF